MLKIITTIAFFICSLVFGQNARGSMGSPKYEGVKFSINQDLKKYIQFQE